MRPSIGRWTHPPTGARASPLGCADRTGGQLGHTGKAGSVTKQNTPAPQWRPGPSKAEMRKQIEAAMARTAALPIKKLPPERRAKLGKRERLIRGDGLTRTRIRAGGSQRMNPRHHPSEARSSGWRRE